MRVPHQLTAATPSTALAVRAPTSHGISARTGKPYLTVREQRAALASATRRATGGIPLYVTRDEVHAALDLLEHKPRERSLLRALWEWGPRRGELLQVRLRDVNFHSALVEMITLKRRPPPGASPPHRVVPCSSTMLGEIGTLVQVFGLGMDDWVFPWSETHTHELVRDALLAAGVDRPKCNCRSLRHGFAVHCIQSGVPLNAIQKMMGHASALTTSIYIQILGRDVGDYYHGVKW